MSLRESVFKKVRDRPEPDGIGMEEFYDIIIEHTKELIENSNIPDTFDDHNMSRASEITIEKIFLEILK